MMKTTNETLAIPVLNREGLFKSTLKILNNKYTMAMQKPSDGISRKRSAMIPGMDIKILEYMAMVTINNNMANESTSLDLMRIMANTKRAA